MRFIVLALILSLFGCSDKGLIIKINPPKKSNLKEYKFQNKELKDSFFKFGDFAKLEQSCQISLDNEIYRTKEIKVNLKDGKHFISGSCSDEKFLLFELKEIEVKNSKFENYDFKNSKKELVLRPNIVVLTQEGKIFLKELKNPNSLESFEVR